MIKAIVNKISFFLSRTSKKRYINYLVKKGVKIGKNFCIHGNLNTIQIDVTRPSLITIGDDVQINSGMKIFTHDFVSSIFLNKFHDFIPSSGEVKIGNNVGFGVNCIVLKGVEIGDNCFIAAGSIVTRNIPSNCIAGGVPAKRICDIGEYYEKRKRQCVVEAFKYVRSIKERYNRNPTAEDMFEEFPLFVDLHNMSNYQSIPIKKQLGRQYDYWIENHKAMYSSMEEFIKEALDNE